MIVENLVGMQWRRLWYHCRRGHQEPSNRRSVWGLWLQHTRATTHTVRQKTVPSLPTSFVFWHLIRIFFACRQTGGVPSGSPIMDILPLEGVVMIAYHSWKTCKSLQETFCLRNQDCSFRPHNFCNNNAHRCTVMGPPRFLTKSSNGCSGADATLAAAGLETRPWHV